MQSQLIVYLGLGSNLGDRKAYIEKAISLLAGIAGVEVLRCSTIIETLPLEASSQGRYLNCVVEIKTSLTPQALLEKTSAIENQMDRTRDQKWAARTIDLDILLFGDEIINTDKLTIPHSQMHLRTFALSGLCELNSQLTHPLLKEKVSVLKKRLNGGDFYISEDKPKLISICGMIGCGKTTLTENIAKLTGVAPLYEPYDKNPFLSKVYAGNDDLALDSELFFLTSRADQLSERSLQAGSVYVSDFIYDKEPIFANKLLNADQLKLHSWIYPLIAARTVSPVMVVYLKDSADNCLERIHQRHRSYEQQIKLSFLESLGEDYDRLIASWKACPVIEVDKSCFDCRSISDVTKLAEKLKYYIDCEIF